MQYCRNLYDDLMIYSHSKCHHRLQYIVFGVARDFDPLVVGFVSVADVDHVVVVVESLDIAGAVAAVRLLAPVRAEE